VKSSRIVALATWIAGFVVMHGVLVSLFTLLHYLFNGFGIVQGLYSSIWVMMQYVASIEPIRFYVLMVPCVALCAAKRTIWFPLVLFPIAAFAATIWTSQLGAAGLNQAMRHALSVNLSLIEGPVGLGWGWVTMVSSVVCYLLLSRVAQPWDFISPQRSAQRSAGSGLAK
jgi:hypothetical protein